MYHDLDKGTMVRHDLAVLIMVMTTGVKTGVTTGDRRSMPDDDEGEEPPAAAHDAGGHGTVLRAHVLSPLQHGAQGEEEAVGQRVLELLLTLCRLSQLPSHPRDHTDPVTTTIHTHNNHSPLLFCSTPISQNTPPPHTHTPHYLFLESFCETVKTKRLGTK